VAEAARAAQVSPTRAMGIAYRHREEIIEMKRKALTLADVTPDRTILEIARVAYSDVRDVLDENGDLLPPTEWSDDAGAAVSDMDTEVRMVGRGNAAVPITLRKIKRFDKNAALSLLARQQRLVGGENDGLSEFANALADRLNAAPPPPRLVSPTTPPLVDVVDAVPSAASLARPYISDEEMAS
jgi:hypothetical protein